MADKMRARPLILLFGLTALLYGTSALTAEPLQSDDSTKYIASLYQLGRTALEDKKFDVAQKYLEQAAATGDAKAQYSLAVMYDEGLGVKYDMQAALDLYTKAAAQGHENARNALTRMPKRRYDGFDAIRPAESALYRALDEVTDTPSNRAFIADATYALGIDSANARHGEPYDYRSAYKWFSISAQHGKADAEFQLGILYSNGLGVLMSRSTAQELFTQAAAHGSPEAQYYLGQMYALGLRSRKDYKSAYHWLKQAARNGHTQGAFFLGVFSEKGLGTKQNYKDAARWYSKVIDNPYAHYQLAMLYEKGRGVAQNYNKAIELYKLEASDFAGSALRLGDLYAHGIGVQQNYADAFSWYSIAANSNADKWVPTSPWNYEPGGRLGILVPYQEQVIHWAAEAQYKLGTLYENGSGVSANIKEAVQWYLKSANAGNCSAMLALGRINLNGTGRNKNLPDALFWFSLATRFGDLEAAKQYLAIQPEISDQQYQQNNDLLADWASKSSDVPLICH